MSEYTPITGELRAAMRQWGWVEKDGSITFSSASTPPSIDAEQSLAISSSDFDRCCDAIDAIHAQLEREYEDLRMKFVNTNRHAQHVERENESLKAELDRVLGEQERDGWVELPKDADGEPIHIGDRMENNERVARIVLTDDSWEPSVYLEKLPNVLHEYFCHEISHYHAPEPDTWESIIEEVLQRGHDDYPLNVDIEPYVARCKALCERTKEDE